MTGTLSTDGPAPPVPTGIGAPGGGAGITVTSGLFAARPAAAAAAKTVYECTDTHAVYYSDGATWFTWQQPDGTYALVDELPWLIDIDPLGGSNANVNWNSKTHDTSQNFAGYNLSSGAQNAEIDWDVVLAAGVWTIELEYYKASNCGIASVQLAGVEVTTVDMYSGPVVLNVHTIITGVVVAAGGKIRLSLVMATQNVSSSGFFGVLSHVQLRRTL